MLRRAALVLLTAGLLAACDRIIDVARQAAAPIDDNGAYLVLEIDTAAIALAQLESASETMASALREANPSIRYTSRGVLGDAARIQLVDTADLPRAREALHTLADTLVFSDEEHGLIEARLTPAARSAGNESLMTESVAVLQRRIGSFRLSVTPLGANRIIVRSAGTHLPEGARSALTTTAQLTFHLVRDVSAEEAAAGRLPPGAMVVEPYPGVGDRVEVVTRRPSLTGARLRSARASTDPHTGEFVLAFELDDEGRRQFCNITRQHTGERFAILLDNQVMTAPRINEPICGGSGQISGNFSAQSMDELAAMLNAGGLPAPITVIAQGIGPYMEAPSSSTSVSSARSD